MIDIAAPPDIDHFKSQQFLLLYSMYPALQEIFIFLFFFKKFFSLTIKMETWLRKFWSHTLQRRVVMKNMKREGKE